ncbi:MAG TPA: peroxidase-related enzyme [Ferruginibacter sp.]|mgnify:CR=1 FL=1|nr:peroxidase-related enzyme [Ferruginibacter sp.]
MPYISLEEHLPGVTGLLEYRQDTGEPLRILTQILLRGPSTLSEAERELIATIVSHRNECVYCSTSHTAAANAYLGETETAEIMKKDIAAAPLSDKMKALLVIASQVQQSGKAVTQQAIDNAKAAGATEMELHDTVMIAAMFCFYNRYVDGLATIAPADPEYYNSMALRLKERGYYRPEQGYDHLKK